MIPDKFCRVLVVFDYSGMIVRGFSIFDVAEGFSVSRIGIYTELSV
jgi:hypothetical protein